MAIAVTDAHLKAFAQSLNREIDKYGRVETKDFLAKQKHQVETLVKLEEEFRKALIIHPRGPGVYRAFVKYIRDQRRNILDARPFFRERQPVFTGKISKALKNRADKGLYKFQFNFQFVRFAVNARKFAKGSRIMGLYNKIQAARTELIEMNMPLAINRARLFWSRTPQSHLSFMDLIQICAEGLISAVDKFCLPYSKVFRSVGIGRMVGNMIEQYSETMLHFFPSERRKIYRANKVMSKCKVDGVVDWKKLAAAVNEDAKPEHMTTPEEICDLITAASCVSTDEVQLDSSADMSKTGLLSRYAAPDSIRPDYIIEQQNALDSLLRILPQLTVFERKLLRLRGFSL